MKFFSLLLSVTLLISSSLIRANELNFDAFGAQEQHVKIEPLAEFNFKSSQYILDLRKEILDKNPGFLLGPYVPSQKIFGPMQSGKPWWGMYGYFTGGGTKESIVGPAEESRFILNPFILFGVREPAAWRSPYSPQEEDEYYIRPTALVYGPGPQARASFAVSNHFSYLIRYNYGNAEKRDITLVGYNANDLGFQFWTIELDKSQNINWKYKGANPHPFKELIHVGGSCGYPGGCNNLSPFIHEQIIEIVDFPANAAIKLWRTKPRSVQVPADFSFTMNFE